MKKYIIFLLLFYPLFTYSNIIEIEGICYNIIEKGGVAEVTKHPARYSGDIIIPEK